MKTVKMVRVAGWAVGVLAGVAAAQPTDSFHVMQIEQVIGGVNGDAGKQAIQLRMRTSFQNLVNNSRLVARDATGANPVVVIAFPSAVTNSATGDRVLVTTAGFNAATSPATVADFTMTNPIPVSYLSAGRLTFEDNFGTIYWSLSWGGAGYTGPTTGSLTNCPSGNFGPSFGGACPSSGVQALLFQGAATAASTANSTDYALTAGAATFTNNARATFSLTSGPAPCYPNCDASTNAPILNALDFGCFLTKFAGGDTYANCDASTNAPILNALDFGCFLTKFAAGCT